MRFNRRRSDRSDPSRRGIGSGLEALERRDLLTGGGSGPFSVLSSNLGPFSVYLPRDLAVYNPVNHQPAAYSVNHQLEHAGPNSPLLGNAGKIVSGKDRNGNEWAITVHGPGYVVVTDTTPNDGSLDDAINTIQLVGTDINKTYVTGTVVASFRVPNQTSTVPFNTLISTTGVRSVNLNGFDLAQTVTPPAGAPNNTTTGVFLTGGVRELSFNDIIAPIDLATQDAPVNVIIGSAGTRKPVQPTIRVHSIFNTVFDSTATEIPTAPNTVPTVNIIVNGQIKDLSFLSTTQDVIDPSLAYLFPVVSTTGRTAVQTNAIGNLDVQGAAVNFTAAKTATPFQNGATGLNRLGRAHFHGPTDAVGLQVNGDVGSLTYDKGVSNTTNLFLGKTVQGTDIPATQYGTPADQTSFAGAGLVGGQVTARSIRKLTVRNSNVTFQYPTNPDFTQIQGTGQLFAVSRPGNAIANGLITTDQNIGATHITGDLLNTEIKSGFNYASYAAGLEGTRAASSIGPYKQNGSLINGVVSATYRPANHQYGTPLDIAGPGKITGNLNGTVINTGGITPLGNVGTGFYARVKKGRLPKG
jgi:hypothetical protein